MAVLQCGGCDRFISMSAVPGGNPVALADPERWSVTRTDCAGCNRSLCDRCAPKSARHCPLCRAAFAQAAPARATAADDEDDEEGGAAWAVQAALKDARRWLAAATAGAVLCVFLFLGKTVAIALVAWVATFMAAWSGTQRLVAAGGASRFWNLAAPIIMFMPLFNIAPLAWLTWRAHSAMAELDEELRAREAREAARERARRRAAAAPAAAPAAAARPAAAPAAAAATGARQAVAYVKLAGLGEVPDGTVLEVSVSAGPPGMPAQDGPVVIAYKGFGVFFALDQGEHFSMVSHGEMSAAGLTPQALLETGLRNLAAIVNGGKPGLSMRAHGSIQALLMGGHFEASLVLLDALWDGPLKARAPGGIVMAMPARDICAFCDAGSAAGVQELRALVERITQGGDHLLTTNLYARRNGRWAELA